jgi:hypothetical protein
MTPEQILILEFESIKEDLIQKHEELGMKATGKWIKSLEVVGKRLSVKILGADYTKQLVSGRPPSEKMPLVQAIKEWVLAKRIATVTNVTGIAWAIAKKIQKEGTRYYPQGTDLVEAVITPFRIQQIIDKVGRVIALETVNEITKLIPIYKKTA